MEVKPLLYSGENMEIPTSVAKQDLCAKQSYWGFQHESWHNGCLQKCTISGRICAAVISITQEIAAKICFETTNPAFSESECKANTQKQIVRMAEFCIYLLDKVLRENDFSWDDILVSYLFTLIFCYLLYWSSPSHICNFYLLLTSC